MRNLLLIAVVALSTTGCGIIYKQPIYQGNLIREQSVSQLQVGQSKQQVNALLVTVFFENDQVTRWEGDYFPTQDADLARNSVRQFGRNLAKDKKKGR